LITKTKEDGIIVLKNTNDTIFMSLESSITKEKTTSSIN